MKPSTLLCAALVLAAPAAADDADRGRTLFAAQCAGCHGPEARGDGPLAGVLLVAPPDLTALAAEAGGVFPAGRVMRRIDGKTDVLAHGGPMPVFGLLLEGPSEAVDTPDAGEIVVPEAIADLAAYLATIQR